LTVERIKDEEGYHIGNIAALPNCENVRKQRAREAALRNAQRAQLYVDAKIHGCDLSKLKETPC
jgi:hypothetical protein